MQKLVLISKAKYYRPQFYEYKINVTKSKSKPRRTELEAMLLCGESAFVKKFTYHYMTYIFVAVQAAAYIRLRFKKFSRVRSRERRTLSLIKK